MNLIYRILGYSLIGLFAGSINAELLVHETFESANMTPSLNNNNFRWDENNRTSIVYGDGSSNIMVWDNGPKQIAISDGRDWTPYAGTHSLRFRYVANEAFTEQRFNLGNPLREVWFSYWIRVPENYRHTTDGGAVNNKFFSLWMDGYEGQGDGSTFWLSMESAGGGNTNLAFTYTDGGYTGSKKMQQDRSFINASSDRNRWMHIVIHLKTESSDGANDGIVETWRKWSDSSSYDKMHENFNVPFKVPPGGPNGFKSGYILGWANGEYTENTEWLVDEFKVSDTSLLDEGNPPVAPDFRD